MWYWCVILELLFGLCYNKIGIIWQNSINITTETEGSKIICNNFFQALSFYDFSHRGFCIYLLVKRVCFHNYLNIEGLELFMTTNKYFAQAYFNEGLMSVVILTMSPI